MKPSARRLRSAPGIASVLPDRVLEIARRVEQAGGRLLVVGGWVRDALRGETAKDLDLEVYGLSSDSTDRLLSAFGFTPPVGKQFPVWRQTRESIDVGLPRGVDPETWESSPASLEPALARASRGRDLTLNAIAFDPLGGDLLDPLGGAADLEAGVLRMADATRFAEDPLRVLRAARLAAKLGARPDPALVKQAGRMDLSGLPGERVAGELRRVLLELERPWRAVEWLDRLGQLSCLGPIAALQGIDQDPIWHPEGDVYVHTGQVVDQAALIAKSLTPASAEILMWSALCHDFGKPDTTRRDEAGRIRSPGHARRSAERARAWLIELHVARRLIDSIEVLVKRHLDPAQFVKQGAGPKGYRRLARQLSAGGVNPVDLERLARADHLGRSTEHASAEPFAAGARFLEAARSAGVDHGVRPDVVSAAALMRGGVEAGPELGRLLARCREIQDETGWTDEARIRVRALEERRARGSG